MGCGGSSQQQVESADGGRQAEGKTPAATATATASASRPPPVAASPPPAAAAAATQRPSDTKAPPPKPPTPPPPAPPLPPPRDRGGSGGGGGGGGESRDADATTQEEPQRKYEAVAEEPPQPPPTTDTAGEAADAAAGAPVAEAEGEMSPAAPAGKAAVRERLGLESASVFDTAFAMEQVDGDIDFAVEMAESMVVQYDDVSASVPEAIRAQEWAAVFEKAHALKGAVATLGVNRVRMVAHALEQAGRVFNDAAAGNGDPARSAYSVPELDVLLEILAEEWDQYLKVFKQETDALRSANQ